MNEIEAALQWVTVFLKYEEMNRATYEDTCGTGDLTEEERTELYQEMDKQINMLKTIKSALEKQIPQKVESDEMDRPCCPSCHIPINNGITAKGTNCKWCGQKLDWSEE